MFKDFSGNRSHGPARHTIKATAMMALAFLLLLTMPNAALAGVNPSLAGSAGTGNAPYSVCVQGGYAYVVNEGSNTLEVFDISNPASPSLAGSTATGGNPQSVCVQGGFAYVVNSGSDTFQVFDISNPASPSVTGSENTGGLPVSVCVQGRNAYVVNYRSNTLQRFDVSNPNSPSLAGTTSTGTHPKSVCVEGGYAYVVNEGSNTLQVFNISSLGTPPLLSTVATGSNPQSICVQGAFAYVVNEGSDTLQVFNISSPSSPSLMGSASTGNDPYSVCVQGAYAFVVNYNSNTFQAFNISNPTSPVLAGSVSTGNDPYSVCVQGAYAYVVNSSSNTLQVFEVATPAPPSLAGTASTGSGPTSVCVQGAYAYVVNYYGKTLQVFDISTPASPSLVGSTSTGNGPNSVCVQGGYAYVVNVDSDNLQVFDISIPVSPTLVGTASTGYGEQVDAPWSVCVQGSYAYVVNCSQSPLYPVSTLQVFDVSNPNMPALAGSAGTVNTALATFSVCVEGGYAYIVNNNTNSIEVFDVSNPAAPALSGSAATGLGANSVCVQGGYAYVANNTSDSMEVFNISNPAAPLSIGSAGTGSGVYSVCVQGGYAYVVNNSGSSIQAFDISTPASPSLAGTANTGSYPRSVCVQGAYAYVVNYDSNTLQVFLLWTPVTPTLNTTTPSSITTTTADSGGNITDNGGASVTSRGVCWSTSSNPTIADSHTTDGSGNGAFTSKITGLTLNTHYHVRAYATNSVGTAYGSDKEFTTLSPPTLATNSATSITPSSATLNGSITATGGQKASQRGFRYRKTGSSTWTEWSQSGSFSTGAFSHPVGGLTPGTGYDFQAWARNAAGTSYGPTRTFTTTDAAPDSTWYLAEGSSDYGFDTFVTIENPNESAMTAAVTYMTGSGPRTRPDVTLPALSQTVINPRDDLGSTDFSTQVVCKEGETIAVDRRMVWTGPGAPSQDGHCSIGVTAPANTWYLPEGSASWGFECWLLIQNPNNSAAVCKITYMIENVGPRTVQKNVPANSRKSFNMADDMLDVATKDASIKVESNVPVIPERAMYRNNRREGHDSIGTTTPANDYYLAEGATGYAPGFITYVLVQNPQNTTNKVTVTYLTSSGRVNGPTLNMAANSRKTIRLNDQLGANVDVSTLVHGDKPIIAERAMYWDAGLGEACHDSIGMNSPHTTFYLPDGEVGAAMETWTLVQNPNNTDVQVMVAYLTQSGADNKVFNETIPANSRKSFNMADQGIQGRASVMVTSMTAGKKIMVERSMYWNNRGAGTDTIGGYSD